MIPKDALELIVVVETYQRVTPDQVLVIALTTDGRERFGDVIQGRFGSDSRFRIMTISDAVRVEVVSGAQAVALVAGSEQDSARAYRLFGNILQAGIPVVVAQPERVFPTAAETRQESGISVAGMFALAGEYVASIQPKGAFCDFGAANPASKALANRTLKTTCSNLVAFDISGSRGLIDALAGRPSIDDIGPVSVVQINVPEYGDALIALRYVSSGLSDGALLLMQDFDHADSAGRRALRQWLEEFPQFSTELYREYGTFSRSFIVHRTD